ncbi:MAG: putative transcriptional regulator [Herbinix sp.]|jgi:predicted transcriptional regulator|nr:putative transcriptional regulator [Herbinix sp.]
MIDWIYHQSIAIDWKEGVRMQYTIFESEYRFLLILWEMEPISSPELVKICEEKLGWKKSTTYTVIKKLTEKRIVESRNTIVSTLVAREQIIRQESDMFLEKTFGGDIPQLFATFLRDRKISREEADRIKKMIEEASESI